jgi:signal peptidase I
MAFNKTQHRLSSRDRLSSIHKRNLFILKIFIAIVVFLFFTSFLFATVKSGSTSMEPSLEKGACSMYYNLRTTSRLNRGDVVIVEAPFYEEEHILVDILNRFIGFFTFQKLQVSSYPREGWINRYLIKRVVALPGDTIKMENWILYIKNEGTQYFLSEFESSEKDYDIRVDNSIESWDEGEYLSGYLPETTLGEGEFFLLGDNRRFSNDSYSWGVLPQERIEGKLFFVYWPLSNFGAVH